MPATQEAKLKGDAPAIRVRASSWRTRALIVTAAVLAGVTIASFLWHAAALVSFPWDWETGEGLLLDYARRLIADPGSLYPRQQVVPVPLFYTPLLPLLMAPLTGLSQPLSAARVEAMAWTLAIVLAVYLLVRRKSGRALALVSAALSLAPTTATFWLALARVDGLMIALWLWAAVLVLPARLQSGADRLSKARTWGGAILLVTAALAKPTAVLLGAPLVLGWLVVDRASAWRLIAATGVVGGVCVAVLQAITVGGFWRCQMLQTLFPWRQGQIVEYLHLIVGLYGPVIILVLMALVANLRRPGSVLRESALLLWLSGPLSLPLMGKYGAGINYLLPWLTAQAVLFGSWIGSENARREWLGLLAGSVSLVVLLGTQQFPVPTQQDRATADAFYGFLKQRGAPILAVRPELAYPAVGQSAEVEWVSFPQFARAHLPGTETVDARLQKQDYRVVVEGDDNWHPPAPGYRPAGMCALGSALGRIRYRLLLPAGDRSTVFSPAPGTRCLAVRP